MKIFNKKIKIPGDTIIVPMFIGCVINTFFPFTSITFLLIILLLFHQMSAYSQHAELVLFYRFFS